MKKKYRVLIQNKKVKYDFEVRRNLTIIQGNSATGKTTLVDMIREYDENGPSSGITLNCERACVVLEGRRWKADLQEITESLVFIDEGNAFVKSGEFAAEPDPDHFTYRGRCSVWVGNGENFSDYAGQ